MPSMQWLWYQRPEIHRCKWGALGNSRFIHGSDPDSPEDLQWHAGEYQKPPYYYCSSFWGLKFIMQRLEVEWKNWVTEQRSCGKHIKHIQNKCVGYIIELKYCLFYFFKIKCWTSSKLHTWGQLPWDCVHEYAILFFFPCRAMVVYN